MKEERVSTRLVEGAMMRLPSGRRVHLVKKAYREGWKCAYEGRSLSANDDHDLVLTTRFIAQHCVRVE